MWVGATLRTALNAERKISSWATGKPNIMIIIQKMVIMIGTGCANDLLLVPSLRHPSPGTSQKRKMPKVPGRCAGYFVPDLGDREPKGAAG
jgi:hypothetical protein